MPSKLLLKKEDHRRIQSLIDLQDSEEYSVVTHRVHGEWKRSIHVFSRLPTTQELNEYENTSSKLKFRGAGKANLESGSVTASNTLYNKLIDRVYDLPIGTRVFGEVNIGPDGKKQGTPLSAKESAARVPALIKREALRDFIGEVYSESRLVEREGDEDDEKVKEENKEDKEED